MWREVDEAPEVDDLEAYWVPDRDDREGDELLDGDDLEDLCPICSYPYPCHCGDDE